MKSGNKNNLRKNQIPSQEKITSGNKERFNSKAEQKKSDFTEGNQSNYNIPISKQIQSNISYSNSVSHKPEKKKDKQNREIPNQLSRECDSSNRFSRRHFPNQSIENQHKSIRNEHYNLSKNKSKNPEKSKKKNFSRKKINLAPEINTYLEDFGKIRQESPNPVKQSDTKDLNLKECIESNSNKVNTNPKIQLTSSNPVKIPTQHVTSNSNLKRISRQPDTPVGLGTVQKITSNYLGTPKQGGQHTVEPVTTESRNTELTRNVALHIPPSNPKLNTSRQPASSFAAGSKRNSLLNIETAFQKPEETSFSELFGPNRQERPNFLQPSLENLNNSFKDYPHRLNSSFNADAQTVRLDRVNNSFNLSVHQQGNKDSRVGFHDALNQSDLFRQRYMSKTNLDTSLNHYYGDPQKNFLNRVPSISEIGPLAARPSDSEANANPQNILGMLDQSSTGPVILEDFEAELENYSQQIDLEHPKPKTETAGDPSKKIVLEHLNTSSVNLKTQITTENESGEGLSKHAKMHKMGPNAKISDILRNMLDYYSPEDIGRAMNAKMTEALKNNPEILETINSVISKNKNWKRVLQQVQTELAKENSDGESDNLKSTISITTEQRQTDRNIVNEININVNTQVKCSALPRELTRLLRAKKKRRRKKRRRRQRIREAEDRLVIRRPRQKEIKGYSERSSSSNASDSSEQVPNCKRVKRESSVRASTQLPNALQSEHDLLQKSQVGEYVGEGGPGEAGDMSLVPIEPEVITVVRKSQAKESQSEGLLTKRPYVKRKRGRPKGSKNSKKRTTRTDNPSRRGSRRRQKASIKSIMEGSLLDAHDPSEMDSDSSRRRGDTQRRSRRRRRKSLFDDSVSKKKADNLGKAKRTVLEILQVTFTLMKIGCQAHADFLNSTAEEAKTLRLILQKKFDLRQPVRVEKLKMKIQKKRNEEINKFVVKRCMKHMMKSARLDSSQLAKDSSDALTGPGSKRKPQSKNQFPADVFKQHEMNSVTSVYRKDLLMKPLTSRMDSLSNVSFQNHENGPLTDSLKQLGSKMMGFGGRTDLASQSDFARLNDFTDQVMPESKFRESSLKKGVFGPIKADTDKVQSSKVTRMSLTGQHKQAHMPEERPDGLELMAKIPAQSKLEWERHFYLTYFGYCSKRVGAPLAKFYMPSTKLANENNREHKSNSQEQSFKTINVKYIKLILRSAYFSKAIKGFLKDTFESSYRDTRNKKLELLAKRIDDPKYIKSVKLPWTMYEMHEAKSTFLGLIHETEREINEQSLAEKNALGGLTPSRKEEKDKSGKKAKTVKRTQSDKKRKRQALEVEEDNFQACFASNNKSNKFLGN